MDFLWQLKAPARVMISGASGTGKTELTKKLIQRANEIFDKPVHRVMWCYTAEGQGSLIKELKETVPSIDFVEGFPEDFENPEPEKHMILVLDDMIQECKNKNMQNVFVRGSHHQNCSVIYLTQSSFGKDQTLISRQMRYITIMRNPRENSNIQTFGRQMNQGRNCPALHMAYEDLANKPYSYLVIDYSQEQSDNARVRNSFFPEDMIVYVKK